MGPHETLHTHWRSVVVQGSGPPVKSIQNERHAILRKIRCANREVIRHTSRICTQWCLYELMSLKKRNECDRRLMRSVVHFFRRCGVASRQPSRKWSKSQTPGSVMASDPVEREFRDYQVISPGGVQGQDPSISSVPRCRNCLADSGCC